MLDDDVEDVNDEVLVHIDEILEVDVNDLLLHHVCNEVDEDELVDQLLIKIDDYDITDIDDDDEVEQVVGQDVELELDVVEEVIDQTEVVIVLEMEHDVDDEVDDNDIAESVDQYMVVHDDEIEHDDLLKYAIHLIEVMV